MIKWDHYSKLFTQITNKMFFSNNLKNIEHCFFSRLGGVSINSYQSLNCGYGSNDNKKYIKQNREVVSEYFNLNSSQLITLYQTHSNKVGILKSNNIKKIRMNDGIVTKQRNIILGILTADCAPVLFYDSSKKIIGACHAGWKGALTGIIQNTISAMQTLGSNLKDIKCSIGPCIAKTSYEVKDDFYNVFMNSDAKNANHFIKKDKNKYSFDLRGYIVQQLEDNRITNISSVNLDTYADDVLFYSYRRSIHRKECNYGRMISTIVIKD